MDQESVFHSVIRREPAYSQLLFNLIKRCHTFRSDFLELILGPQYATTNIEHLRLENTIVGCECGRPDWEICSDKLRAFVEIKVDLTCGLTNLQEPITESGDLNGYAKFLSEQPKDKHKMLVFLVPGRWPTDALEMSFPHLHDSGVEAKIVRWEHVLDSIDKCQDADHDILLDEFRKLLQERFGTMKFDDAERSFLLSKDFRTTYSACFKVNELVDELKEKIKEKLKDRVQTRIEILSEKGTDNYFGFYLRKKERNGFLLWVGVWPDCGIPISFGVGVDDEHFSQNASEAFTAGWQGRTKQCNGYQLADLPETLLQGDDPFKAVWEKLAPVLDRVIADA